MKTAFAKTSNSKSYVKIAMGLVLAGAIIGAIVIALPHQAPNFDPPFEMVEIQNENGEPLFVQSNEITVSEWNRCFDAKGCALRLSSKDDAVDYPATGINYQDAMEFIGWINSQSTMQFRLPTSAEWYGFADEVLPIEPEPIFTDPNLTWASAYLTEANKTGRALRPTGAFATTESGISDLDGNVWEWTQDCIITADADRCPAYVVGGEHRAVIPYLVRDPARGGCAVGAPPAHLGLRLVSDGMEP